MVGALDIIGDPDKEITGLNELNRAREGDLVFVAHSKYLKKAFESPATCIIVPPGEYHPNGKILLIVSDPFKAFNYLARKLNPRPLPQDTWIHPTAKIHPSVHISPGVFIGADTVIEEGTIIYPNVTILDNVRIGKHCKIGPHTVIGYDAFYYHKNQNNELEPMYSAGTVVIEDYVEIGAHCTIDRGVTDETIIGRGTKIDNHVHIGHDVIIGRNCIIAAQVGIAGGCIIEDEVVIWGQAGITKTVRIGKGAVINAKAGVTKTLAGGKSYTGSPAVETELHHRQIAVLKFLVRYWDKVKKLLR